MIIPFFIPHAGCPHQCVFCDQKRITGRAAPPDPASIPATIEACLASNRRRSGATHAPHDSHSREHPGRESAGVQVAFYGGSFTALSLETQRVYLEQVQPFIASGAIRGIRLSTRPDAITPGILPFLRELGVTTVELGAQSLDDEVLRRSGRGHGADDAVRALALLKERGFVTGVQLMPGLPGDTAETFEATVGKTIALRPDFVRLYPALVIRNTPLEDLYRDGRYRPLSLDEALSLCAAAVARFEDAGIDVIRVGLQPTEELERPGTIVAGPYHPAFRQLVDSALFLERMRRLARPGEPLVVLVNPADLSPAIGHRRRNVLALRESLGIDAVVLPDPSVPRRSIRKKEACFRTGPDL